MKTTNLNVLRELGQKFWPKMCCCFFKCIFPLLNPLKHWNGNLQAFRMAFNMHDTFFNVNSCLWV